MLIQKAYKFRLKLRSRQEQKLRRTAGCCRLVWNKMLALQKTRLAWNEPILSYENLASILPVWKEQLPFLKDPPSQTLQYVAKSLSRALENAFHPKMPQCFPTFKKKGQGTPLLFPQGFEWDKAHDRVSLPKLGWLRYRNSFPIDRLVGEACQMHLTQEGEHWNLSIQVQYEIPAPTHPATAMEAIDLGVVNFATLSDYSIIKPLDSFRRHEEKLGREQRNLSRKQKFSQNWLKAKHQVNHLHRTIGHCRQDFLHKHSTQLSKNHAVLFVEDLRIGNMTASAAGTPEEPGRNVRAKAGLNKAILDQGWGEFRRQLDYKLTWRGGRMILVPPHHTSQDCPQCHHIEAANRRSRDTFCCQRCAYTAPADLVGAINVKRRGTSLLPVEGPEGSSKQEPTRPDVSPRVDILAGIPGL